MRCLPVIVTPSPIFGRRPSSTHIAQWKKFEIPSVFILRISFVEETPWLVAFAGYQPSSHLLSGSFVDVCIRRRATFDDAGQ
jgi:hypothetical protein